MPDNSQRINAVIAALEKIRDHLEKLDDDEQVDAATYNRWIGMLDGVVDGNWQNLALADEPFAASEVLMHTEAAIAFLEAHRQASG